MRAKGDPTPVVILTGVSDVDLAVRAMKLGAFDYLTKPVDDQNLLQVLENAIEHRTLHQTIDRAPEAAHAAGPRARGGVHAASDAGRRDDPALPPGGEARRERRQHLHLGRERQRQGNARPRHPPGEPAQGRTLRRRRGRQPRPRQVPRVLLRPGEGLARRARGDAGAPRAGGPRHAVPQQHRRPLAPDAGEAQAPHPDGRVLPRELDDHPHGGRADDRLDRSATSRTRNTRARSRAISSTTS